MKRLNIAIDGPSGAGKSTLAKMAAKALKIYYLDTGAMYRAAAYAAVKAGVDIGDPKQVEEFMDKLELKTVYEDGNQAVYAQGENVMPYIRTPEISKASSDISAYPCVRYKLVEMQRETAKQYDLVLDGRDIGTFVLPDAKYKFFLTADARERARRRFLELQKSGIKKSFDEVLGEMIIRDENDSKRSLAPLKKADDAMLLDTTNMNEKEALEAVLSVMRAGENNV
jgi:CMP/dCMP kinase